MNCLLCCVSWYSWGIIRSSLCIRTRSLRIRTCSCKILQHYVPATVQMHSGAVFSSIRASRMKKFIKIKAPQQLVVLYKPPSLGIRQPDTCKSVLISVRYRPPLYFSIVTTTFCSVGISYFSEQTSVYPGQCYTLCLSVRTKICSIPWA